MQNLKPRKVLIFSLSYYPRFIGGAEVAIKEITDRISTEEYVFDMVTAKLGKGLVAFEKIGNVNIYRVGFGNKFDKILFPVLGTIKTLFLIKRYHYDFFWPIMITYSTGVPYIINLIRKLFGFKKIPVLLTIQEGDSEEHIQKKKFGISGVMWRIILLPVIVFLPKKFHHHGLISLSWALALPRTDKVTVLSNYLRLQAENYGYKGSIEIIPNGVDLNLFSNGKEKNKKNYIQLITTSRLVEKNAVGDIIDALVYLPENINFQILGQGYEEEELKAKVINLKLGNRVTFLGYIPHKDMPKYLHESDIFIRPSLSEGFGNSFIEAMAARIPVIATPVGGIVDFLKDGETGLFCEVKNPRSIAQKVEKLLKDKESHDYIVRNAYEMVQSRYDWSIIANDMKNKVFLRII